MTLIFKKDREVYSIGDIVSNDSGIYRIDCYCNNRRTCVLTNITTGQVLTLTEECIKDMLHIERK
jgi:hypothetical protein